MGSRTPGRRAGCRCQPARQGRLLADRWIGSLVFRPSLRSYGVKTDTCKLGHVLTEVVVKGKTRRKCLVCQARYHRDHYDRNKAAYKKSSAASKKTVVARNRRYVYDYLACHPCKDCGEKDPIVLEFDHLSDKDRAIAQLIICGVSVEKIQSEIDKCEVVCANCHRRRTARRGNHFRASVAQLVERQSSKLAVAGSTPVTRSTPK